MRRTGRRRWNEDRGSSLVEFALVSVLFILVLLSVVEVSRMILDYTTVAQAAKAGARYAVVHGADRTGSGASGPSGPSCGPSSCTQINTVVKNFAAAGLLNTSNLTVTVSYPDSSNAAGYRVVVDVSYPYDPLIGYFSHAFSKTLSSSSEGIIAF